MLKEQLVKLIRDKALEYGDFTLASGKKASFYLDCRKITMDSEAASVIAKAMLEELKSDWPDAVGGMAVGAVPIAAAVLVQAGHSDRELRGFFVRKQTKDHGTERRVEGPVHPGDRVVILEDVVTSGGSAIDAVQLCREYGLIVDRAIAIVDREAGAAERFAEIDCDLRSLVTLSDLGIEPSRC